jgi:ParB/RepB/Spo0J family partition protein
MSQAQADVLPGQVTEIPITKLLADPDQPRKSFDEAGLEQLADSIGKSGILVPLHVRAGLKGKYIIQDGERRYRAAKLAKLKAVPVLLVNGAGDEQSIRATQFAVNNLRERFTHMEVARMLADLQRKHFNSVNDLAVHLDKAGLPAMTPKQIKDAIALVDLPEWVHGMIDAGQIEASAAAQIKIAMPYPEVLKDSWKGIEQDIQWRVRVTAQETARNLANAFSHHGADLNRTNDYYDYPGSIAVYFNPKTACKGCEHLVSVDAEKYCMNVPEFERKNAEAKAAGLLPGGKNPAKSTTPEKVKEEGTEQKAEQRNRTLGDKAREYLHAYLVRRITEYMQLKDAGGRYSSQIDITDELLAWHAMGHPGLNEYYDRRSPAIPKYEGAESAHITCLESLFAAADLDTARLNAALQIAHDLPWRETQVVCHQLWGSSIESVWTMDEAFVGLFRKAELIHLAELHKLASPEGKTLEALKLSELRENILAQYAQVKSPKLLCDIYSDVAEPYTSYAARIRDLADDEDEDEAT